MFINCCNIFCASEAVRRLHADATNEELHKLISSWLVGSRDRGGGKAVRQERERAQREERGPGERQKQQQTLPPRHKRSHKWTLNSVGVCVCVCVCVGLCALLVYIDKCVRVTCVISIFSLNECVQ